MAKKKKKKKKITFPLAVFLFPVIKRRKKEVVLVFFP